MKWAILLGSPDISGGTYVIFEHAVRAVRRGVDVTIVTEEPVTPRDYFWHLDATELTWKTFAEAEAEHFDIAIATWWRTVYEVHRVPATRYAYFVQSIEAWFYPPEDRTVRALADATYAIGLPVITEATWIKRHLAENAAVPAQLVRNGIRKDVYTEEGPAEAQRREGSLRVLVEGPLHVAFKNVERTIELCRASKADEVWLLTSSQVSEHPGVNRVFSRIPIFETPRVYRSCDVIVKLSYIEGMFGPPLEMFHCGGTAITYDVTGHDEYLRTGENALIVPCDHEPRVIALLDELKAQPGLLHRLKDGARRTAAAWHDWDTASREFELAVDNIVKGGSPNRDEVRVRSRTFMDMYALAEDYRQEAERENKRANRDLKAHVRDAVGKLFAG
jgi:O-antigen biosynthesis protein